MESIKGNPIIEVKGVTKIYQIGQTKLRALDDVSVDIYPGEFTCIIGRSGSGKSTMLNMIAGLEKPTKGHIRIAGKQIDRMNEATLVQFRLDNVGFVFQSFNLFAMHTALDNVAMPLMYKGIGKVQRTRRARKIMTAVGLQSHMNHKPTQMSGGQQQRVGIARALVTTPKIMFADEPTGNLDLKTSREILRLIRTICKERNTTLIMVTHDPEMAMYADRVIKLLDGKVLENIVNPAPSPITLVKTLPDGTVVEIDDDEAERMAAAESESEPEGESAPVAEEPPATEEAPMAEEASKAEAKPGAAI